MSTESVGNEMTSSWGDINDLWLKRSSFVASYKPGPEAVVAEAVEALGEHCVLPLDLARGTRERLLVLADLLLQDLVHVGRHLDLTQTLNLQREEGREG